ncbi:unnamed protein product [Candida verbasci]|uniref:Uncharacterized protein n=1 Tax=Candida verbasci TaxID=1227364 RepID=A0A9W4TZC8_9ASCO|nr:unnamed protein product [Candida verbasci]
MTKLIIVPGEIKTLKNDTRVRILCQVIDYVVPLLTVDKIPTIQGNSEAITINIHDLLNEVAFECLQIGSLVEIEGFWNSGELLPFVIEEINGSNFKFENLEVLSSISNLSNISKRKRFS